ncbi:MAG: lauroyl acyltransferase, partial [Zetaproteobacteria bacterium]|nr:lauroyl acyltransferase [Zetaproteobacteria bacterium]
EKRKVSMLPTGFWVLSLIGSLMILSYAIIRKDPVLFIGQIFGFIVYSRNITLAFKSKKAS